MKAQFFILLSCAFITACATPNHSLVTVRPERWDAELSTSTGWHSRYVVAIHDYGRGFSEFVISRGEIGKPPLSYKTLYVESLSQTDLAHLYDWVLETVRDFRFAGEQPPMLDGGSAQVELRIGRRSLAAGFSPFADTKELPTSVQRIMRFADSRLAKSKSTKPNDG